MIVSIGWGSLIWCQKSLPVDGNWHTDGPDLPVEFARESRDGRMTLVICAGAPACRTLWAALTVKTVDEARHALAQRESIESKNIKSSIGLWTRAEASSHAESAIIGHWAYARGFEGVVWTALKPRFGNVQRVPTVEEFINHLRRLEGARREIAEEYVRFAPRQIATPYRTAIEKALGWTPTGAT